MVVCSDNWVGTVVALLEQSDREYFGKNSFYLPCDETLWVEPKDGHVSVATALVAEDLIISRAFIALVLVCLHALFKIST